MPHDLPRLALPWPPAVNPHVDVVEREVVAWAQRWGLAVGDNARRRLESMTFGVCAAHTFARADVDDLVLCGTWLVWIFLLDDRHGQPGADSPRAWDLISERIGRALRGEHDEDPLSLATADICRRTFGHTRMTDGLARRFAGHVELLLDGFRREAEYDLDNLPDADAYIANRRRNAGMYLFADLLELTESTVIPAELYATSAFQDLLDATTDIGAWQNDVISLDAEESRGELSNFVTVLRLTAKLSRDEAVAAVSARISARISEFASRERELSGVMDTLRIPADEQDRVADYVAQLRQWVNGCLVWSCDTKRYADPSLFQPEALAAH